MGTWFQGERAREMCYLKSPFTFVYMEDDELQTAVVCFRFIWYIQNSNFMAYFKISISKIHRKLNPLKYLKLWWKTLGMNFKR